MNRKPQLVLAFLLGAITLLVYWPVRHHEFLLYDDADYVTENHVVQQGLTWEGTKWAFTTFHSSNWHPLTWLSHMLDVKLFGPGPAGPHLVNVLLHVANTILLFLLLQRLTGALWRSALVAALFALHPLHVESVAWVAERKDVLSAFFFLLTLWAYTQYVRRSRREETLTSGRMEPPHVGTYGWYGVALVLFALGLMSKPMLVTLPCVLLLLDWWPLKRVSGARGQVSGGFSRLLLEKVPFFGLSVLSCVMTFVAQKHGGAVRSLASFPVDERIGNALVSYERYLEKTFWPTDLAIFYPHPGHWPVGQVIVAALVIAALSFGAVWFARRFPFAAAGWFWFLGMLIPTIGLVQVSNQSMADRYTYLPLIGVFIVLTWSCGEVLARWRPAKAVIVCVGVIAIIACAARTIDQVRYWRDGVSLFQHALAVTKENFVAHNNLGSALLKKGDVDAAIEQFRVTLRIRPDYADACCNLGAALLRKGLADEAIVWFRKTLELQPGHALARYNLATVLLDRNQLSAALVEFEKALELRPDDVPTRINYGNALLQAGRTDAAVAQYRAVLKLRPDHADARNNLGTVLWRAGNLDEAAAQFEQVLKANPRHANAHNNLAELFLQQGQMEKAIAHYRSALAIEPANAEARNNLANALLQLGRVEEAIVELRSALQVRPDFAEARSNLGYALLQTRRAREAVAEYDAALKLQPDNVRTLASLAWVLATSAEPTIRNGARAVELAERANQLSAGQEPMVLHSVAAAYAESGRFAEATTAAQRALQLAEAQSNGVLAEMLRSELKVYQSGAPFREGQGGGQN